MNRKDLPPPLHEQPGGEHPSAHSQSYHLHQMRMESLLALCEMQYWEYDIESGIVYLNKFAEDQRRSTSTGASFTRDEALEYIHTDDRLEVSKGVERLVSGQTAHIELEFRAIFKDGTEKWYMNKGLVLRTSPEGIPQVLGGFVQDISLQKKLQSQLTGARKHAEESDRLKTAFLTNMSHEIRTPMNAIIGFSELMSDPNISKEDVILFAGIIKTRSTQLLQIVSDILDIARIESNQVEIKETAFALNPLLDDLYMVYAQKLIDDKKNLISLRVEKALHDASFLILSDELRLRQILNNLLDNAVKFTREGSISFGYRLTGGELVFYVKDSGLGIPSENHAIIFERFRQADVSLVRQFGGNGLGLSICKALVEMMGGRIWLESTPGVGTEFFFTLPKSRVANTDSPSVSSLIGMPVLNWQGKRILLVEDDPISAGLLREVLSRTGVELITASTAGEAYKIINSQHFDLVLMDVLLPDMSGLELTRMIKELKPGLPVIAQTAYAMPGHNMQCLQAGCDEYITKPVNISELFSVVNRYLRP